MDLVESLVNIIVNNGIGVVCVAYMIYFQLTTMKEMTQTINKMNTALELISERLENIEDKLEGKKKETKKESKK